MTHFTFNWTRCLSYIYINIIGKRKGNILKFLILDVECTGLSVEHNELTEVSILDCESLEQITWMIRIRHPEKCSKEAMYITKKTPEELMSRGRYIEDVLDEITEFMLKDGTEIDDICVIAHNASFDRRFISKAFESNNKKFPAIFWLDTKEMARKYTKTVLGLQKTSLALNQLLITANIKSAETKDIHSGAVDCRNEMRLWKKMTAAGMSNSEFIKMDPNYLNKSTPIKKKGKKAKVEEYSLDDIMEEESSEQLFEENDD